MCLVASLSSSATSRVVVPDDVVSVAEAATLLRCSRQFVYGLIDRGALRAYRIGEDGPLRIPLTALRAILHEAA